MFSLKFKLNKLSFKTKSTWKIDKIKPSKVNYFCPGYKNIPNSLGNGSGNCGVPMQIVMANFWAPTAFFRWPRRVPNFLASFYCINTALKRHQRYVEMPPTVHWDVETRNVENVTTADYKWLCAVHFLQVCFFFVAFALVSKILSQRYCMGGVCEYITVKLLLCQNF